jgi:hypothetical protein
MNKTYIIHSDPGHAWIAVKRAELISLGILDQVTRFSYQHGKTVYLEEDIDAGLFISAYEAQHGVRPSQRVSYQDYSPVRSYEGFHEN